MASGLASGTTLRHLHDLFSGGTAVGLTDGQLLARYTASNDGPAFAALVARHGPMVAATCRAVLRHEHDVEDAFQATFLVLARKAGSVRAGDALGGWLHRVAYRVAVQANIEVKRRRRRESDVPPMEIPAAARPVLDLDLCSIVHRRDRPAARASSLAGRALRPGGAELRAGRHAARLDRAGPPLPAVEGAGATAWSPGPARRDGQRIDSRVHLDDGCSAGGRGDVGGGGGWRRRRAARARRRLTRSAQIILRAMLMTKLKIAAAAALGAAGIVSAGVSSSECVQPDDRKPAMNATAKSSLSATITDQPKQETAPERR